VGLKGTATLAAAGLTAPPPAPALPHPMGPAEDDQLVRAPHPVLEGMAVAILPRPRETVGFRAVSVSSPWQVETTALARALHWGVLAFGADGFAVYEAIPEQPRSGAPPATPPHYAVVRVWPPVDEAELRMEALEGDRFGFHARHWEVDRRYWADLDGDGRAELVVTYRVRVLVTPEDRSRLYPPSRAAVAELERELAATPEALRAVPAAYARIALFDPVDALLATGSEDDRAAAVALLERIGTEGYLLLAQDRPRRDRYLAALLQAHEYLDDWRRSSTAVIAILGASGSPSELKATVAQVQAAGLLTELLRNAELLQMLATIGRKFGRPDPIDAAFLLEVLQDLKVLPRRLSDVFVDDDDVSIAREVDNLLYALASTLRSSLEGVVVLITDPGRLVDGVQAMARLCWTVVKAVEFHDVEAMTTLYKLLERAGEEVVAAVRGLALLQEATGPGQQEATAAIADRVKWALVFEVATAFVGIAEIRAAVVALRELRMVGAAGRFLAVARRVGAVFQPGRTGTRVQHLAHIVAWGRTELGAAEDVAELLARLPDADVAALARAIDATDFDRSIAGVAALVQAHPALGHLVEDALPKLRATHLLRQKARALGEDVVAAVNRAIRPGGFAVADVHALLEALPEGQGGVFARMISRIPDAELRPGGVADLAFLRRAAAKPSRMSTVDRLGLGPYRALATRAGADDAHLDDLVTALVNHPRSKDPVRYQGLLDRVAAVELGALVELETFAPGFTDVDIRRLARALRRRPETLAGLDRILRLRRFAPPGRQGHYDRLLRCAQQFDPNAPLENTGFLRLVARIDEDRDDQVRVLARIAYEAGDSEADTVLLIDRLVDEPTGMSGELLNLAAQVEGRVDSGLASAVRAGLYSNDNSLQGALGHLYAVRSTLEDYPLTRVDLELVVNGGTPEARHLDIRVHLPDRTLDVEVKTNLQAGPTIDPDQIRKDLLRHAPNGWDNLFYRYNLQQEANLDQVRDAFRAALDSDVVAKTGLTPAAAWAKLEARLADTNPVSRLVGTYRY
jgi:hypothetical protein